MPPYPACQPPGRGASRPTARLPDARSAWQLQNHLGDLSGCDGGRGQVWVSAIRAAQISTWLTMRACPAPGSRSMLTCGRSASARAASSFGSKGSLSAAMSSATGTETFRSSSSLRGFNSGKPGAWSRYAWSCQRPANLHPAYGDQQAPDGARWRTFGLLVRLLARSGRRGREFKSPPPDRMQRAWSQALSPRPVAVLLAARSRFHRAFIAGAAPRYLAPIAAAAASLSSVTTWA